MRYKLLSGICLAFSFFTTTLWADDNHEQMFDTKFSGYTFIEAGEVVKGFGYVDAYDHRWLSDACVGIFATTNIDKNLKVLMGLEGQLTYSFNATTTTDMTYVSLRYPNNSFWVSQGEGIYTFGDLSGTSLQIEAGYFPYKYNPEVRNLGEYLFRTYCYPTVMFNKFDRTFTELMGIRVGNTINGIFHHDLIINSETKQYPFYDFSLSYLADVKTPAFSSGKPNLLTLGGGIQLYRFIPIRGDLTNIHDPNGSQNEVIDTIINSTTNDTTFKQTWIGFGGTKVMGRATLDCKAFLPEFITGLLGKEDLKVYGEIAVLGWKNYKRWYTDRTNRMPLTIGINWPTFKFLDILNTELEFLNSPYMNDDYEPVLQLIPTPYPDLDTPHEKLKWSVYAKKYIGKRMSLMAQVANDHLIPTSGNPIRPIQDYHDVTLKHGDWWWNFRARFDF